MKINHYEPIRDYKKDGETNYYYIGLTHIIPAETFPDDAGSSIEVQYEDYDYIIEQAKALGYEVGTPIERFEAFDFNSGDLLILTRIPIRTPKEWDKLPF